MREIEIDCYIGEPPPPQVSSAARTRYPIEGLCVHPKTGLVREQSHTLIRRRHRRHR